MYLCDVLMVELKFEKENLTFTENLLSKLRYTHTKREISIAM